MIYARSQMPRVSRTLWSVISTPMPRSLRNRMIRWMSSTAIGSTPAKGWSSRMKAGLVPSAGVHANEADDHVEAGGLAGAVGAEQPHHLAARDLERHVLHHGSGLVALAQALRAQPAHCVGRGVHRSGILRLFRRLGRGALGRLRRRFGLDGRPHPAARRILAGAHREEIRTLADQHIVALDLLPPP